MSKRIPWTKEEDNILIQAIKESPYNKAVAFKVAAQQLILRDAISCKNRWYNNLSNPKSPNYVKLFTIVGSDASQLNNRTSVRNDSYIKHEKIKENIWVKIKRLLGF